MAVMPLASMVRPLALEGEPGATETIFPARTTIDPRSITVAFGPMMRALVIVTSCAESGANAASIRQMSSVKLCRFILFLLLVGAVYDRARPRIKVPCRKLEEHGP